MTSADRRIRVLNVVSSLEMGGTRSVLLDQLAKLPHDRFELAVLTLGDDLDKYGRLLPPSVAGLAVSYHASAGYGVLNYLGDSFLLQTARRAGRQAVEAIERYRPDVLHFHTHPRELGLGILARRRMPRVALVFTDHLVRMRPTDYPPQTRMLLKLAYRRLYRQYHLVSVGETVARFNALAGFVGRARQHLVFANRVDIDRFRVADVGRSDRPVEIVFVGRVHPVKGVDTLIRAYGQMKTQVPTRLVIIGPDEMDGAMQALAAPGQDALHAVDFLGERDDIADLLSGASIGVLASRREGRPLALLEQMATGLVVVVSDIPELSAIVSDGVNGLVVPVGDVVGLAAALERLVQQPDLRVRLGRAAREAVERSAVVDTPAQLTRLYQSVARPAPEGQRL